MPMYDFVCPECGREIEHLCGRNDPVKCTCNCLMEKVWKKCPITLGEIIPSYPGSKKQAAGYVHSHADRPATKVQSGYGGIVNPKN